MSTGLWSSGGGFTAESSWLPMNQRLAERQGGSVVVFDLFFHKLSALVAMDGNIRRQTPSFHQTGNENVFTLAASTIFHLGQIYFFWRNRPVIKINESKKLAFFDKPPAGLFSNRAIEPLPEQIVLALHPARRKNSFMSRRNASARFLAWIVLARTGLLGWTVFSAPASALPNYFVRAWQAEQGLPQNKVAAAVQDRDGYLWVGHV